MAKLIDKDGANYGAGPWAGMLPGDMRTHVSKSGNALTLTRTSRAFIDDYADAANDVLVRDQPELAKTMMWVVDDFGKATKLVTKRFYRGREPAVKNGKYLIEQTARSLKP